MDKDLDKGKGGLHPPFADKILWKASFDYRNGTVREDGSVWKHSLLDYLNDDEKLDLEEYAVRRLKEIGKTGVKVDFCLIDFILEMGRQEDSLYAHLSFYQRRNRDLIEIKFGNSDYYHFERGS